MPRQYRPGTIAFPFVAIGDGGAVFAISTLGLYLREGAASPTLLGWIGISLVAVMVVVALWYRGLYRLSVLVHWPNALAPFLLVLVPMAAIGWILATAPRQVTAVSTASLAIAIVGGALMSAAHRVAVSTVLTRRIENGQGRRRIAVIGSPPTATMLVEAITDAGALFPATVVGRFDDQASPADNGAGPSSSSAGIDDLVRDVRHGLVDDVVICLPRDQRQRLDACRQRLYPLPVHVYQASEARARRGLHSFDQLRLLQRPPLADWRWPFKRIVDVALAATLIVLLIPVLVVIAVAIKLESPGPLLFRQQRHGFNSQPFTIYKFRTMRHDPAPSPFKQTERNDPRVTRVGWLLRRTSLDELPQLLNVLDGSMSMVGPRPHPLELDAEYAPLVTHFDARYRVKPGITGQAQVAGYRGAIRSLPDMEARIRSDLNYIDHWSPMGDLKILLVTAGFGWMHPRAY